MCYSGIGECRRAAQEKESHYWKLTREGQDLLVGSMEGMLERSHPREAWEALLEKTPVTELRNACAYYRESRRLEQTGYVGILRERLRWQVRPYLQEFLKRKHHINPTGGGALLLLIVEA